MNRITAFKKQSFNCPVMGKRRRGATMVEFALIVPILLAILIGILEFGWMVKNKLQLANAVREGARDAAVGVKTDPSAKDTDSIEARIRNRSAGLPNVDVPDAFVISLQRDNPDNAGYNYDIALSNKLPNSSGKIFNDAPTGSLIRVRVTLKHRSLTNFPFTTNRTLQTEVIMRRESGG